MNQRIRVRIAGHEYEIRATSSEQEKLIRLASEEVNKKLDSYRKDHPGRSDTDLLAFVALNNTISGIAARMQLDYVNSEIESLRKDIDNYLENNLK